MKEQIKKLEDRLAELEAVILQHYLDKGYKLEKDQEEGDVKWGFRIAISSDYKQKVLHLILYKNREIDYQGHFDGKTTKEMYDKAFEHFRSAE